MDDLMRAMAKTAFGGRRLGEAADVLESMVTDPAVLQRAHAVGRDDRSRR
jgi:deoxyhypusine synthase